MKYVRSKDGFIYEIDFNMKSAFTVKAAPPGEKVEEILSLAGYLMRETHRSYDDLYPVGSGYRW